MYKIYINEIPLFLVKEHDLTKFETKGEKNPVFLYNKKKKSLFNYIDMLEKGRKFEKVIIYSDDFELLTADFFGVYKVIVAGGGIVFYKKTNLALFIYRNNMWDLPKGKVEKGETIEQTALREVSEEVGLRRINIDTFLGNTFHTYFTKKGKRVLKKTVWYKMTSLDKIFELQVSEGIERAEWLSLACFLDSTKQVYPNIVDVCRMIKI